MTKIQINEDIQSLEVGQDETLTVTVIPNNATNKSITWKSDNESIATINSSGKVTAKKDGTVNIVATSSNGKTSTIKLNVKEEPKVEKNVIANTITTTNSDKINNVETNNKVNDIEINNQSSSSNPLGGIVALGLLGGGGYLGYKKLKK